MITFCFITILHIFVFAAGVYLGLLSRRVRAFGWVAFILVLLPVGGLCLVSWFAVPLSAEIIISTLNFFFAPLALFYSIHAYRRAPDRFLALAALVGAIIVGVLSVIGLIIIVVTFVGSLINGPDFSV